MRHLFLPAEALQRGQALIEDETFHHLAHVLRAKAGEELVLLDNLGHAFHARLVAVEKRRALAELLGPALTLPEPQPRVTVAQAIGKGDRFEEVLQHGTELGASTFVPMLTERSNVRIEPASVPAKLERWQRIVKGAAEQCHRPTIPSIEKPRSLSEVVKSAGQFGESFLLQADGEEIQPNRSPTTHGTHAVLLLIGPEGGFSEGELELARKAGLEARSVGCYVLRTETAALAALAKLIS